MTESRTVPSMGTATEGKGREKAMPPVFLKNSDIAHPFFCLLSTPDRLKHDQGLHDVTRNCVFLNLMTFKITFSSN